MPFSLSLRGGCMKTIEELLTKAQKEEVIKKRLSVAMPRIEGEVHSISYDRRFGFDFEVLRGPAGKARVTFSLSIEDPRFPDVVRDCAQACYEVRFTSTTASAIRGNSREEG
jgi:hypothetical protein